MSIFDWIAEERIKSAMENGLFNDLPGKGQPLNLEDNAHEPEDWRIAFHVLRNSDTKLPWIESSRQIENALAEARQDAVLACKHAASPSEWERHANRFLERIAALNRQIIHYNLQVPSDRFQRPLLDPKRELAAVEEQKSETPSSR
jgi:hypothetical protein